MEHSGMVRFIYPGGRFTARATTVKFLLEWAYGIQPFQHSTGPSWMASERYDVTAKAEGNPTDAQMKLMVQTLLSEHFKLQVHHESRKQSVYVLTVGKAAPKLFAPKEDEVHGMKITPQADSKPTSFHVAATRFTLAQLTEVFARQLGHAMVNETGLDGEYDFTLDLTPDESAPNPLDPSHLLRSLREQLGLIVKTQEAPVDFLVVDGGEKVVAGN